MRHMAANFYELFKNKNMMNLFKRLCTQNQQRKFDALWGIIDDMSAELLKSQSSSSNRRRSTDSLVRGAKPFTQWIDGAPKRSGHLCMTQMGGVTRSRRPTMLSVTIW